MSRMKTHITAVHVKKGIRYKGIYLLMCKCAVVESRGADGRTRNAHFHCPVCNKGVQGKLELREHLISRHGIEEDDIPLSVM